MFGGHFISPQAQGHVDVQAELVGGGTLTSDVMENLCGLVEDSESVRAPGQKRHSEKDRKT